MEEELPSFQKISQPLPPTKKKRYDLYRTACPIQANIFDRRRRTKAK